MYACQETIANLTISTKDCGLVRHLFSGVLTPGYHQFVWNGKDDSDMIVPAGIYISEITNNAKFTSVKKIIILK